MWNPDMESKTGSLPCHCNSLIFFATLKALESSHVSLGLQNIPACAARETELCCAQFYLMELG